MNDRVIGVKFNMASGLKQIAEAHEATKKVFSSEIFLRKELNKTAKKIQKAFIDDFIKYGDPNKLNKAFNLQLDAWRLNNGAVKRNPKDRKNRKSRKNLAKACLATAKAMLKN